MYKQLFHILAIFVTLLAAASSPRPAKAGEAHKCYVDSDAAGSNDGLTWLNAFTSLQVALQSADCNPVWVAAGVYKPGVTRPDTFTINPAKAVYGSFSGWETSLEQRQWTVNLSILSGDVDTNDANHETTNIDVTTADIVGSNSYHVVSVVGTGDDSALSTTVLDGFIITGGSASESGGGLYCYGSGSGHKCSPTLSNLVFSGNRAQTQGGGIFNDGSSSGDSSPELTNLTFHGNYAPIGGAMFNNGGSGTSSPTLKQITFSMNSALYGGGVWNNGASGVSSPSLTNVTFSSNSATQYGGGMASSGYNGVSSPTLINVTFANNSATFGGGAMFNEATGGDSHPILANVILAGDTAPTSPEIYDNLAYPIIRYSIIPGGCGPYPEADCTGGGILDGTIYEPRLGALANNGGDTKTRALMQGSSAIDSGSTSDCPLVDQRGVSRPQGTACDIGAVEMHQLTSWVGGITVLSNRNLVAVGRPHISDQVMGYSGFTAGSKTMYVPMLFRRAFGGSYNAALYVQNLDPDYAAKIDINYYDVNGTPSCVHGDLIPPLSSHGYWMPTECMSDGWVGGAVITSSQNVVAVGRPHIGTEVTSYNGFATGSSTMYVPMLFRKAFGGSYNAALYVQNVDPLATANVTIDYYDVNGGLTCTHNDSIGPRVSHGYWMPTECMSDGWVGGAVVSSAGANIVAVGRPHVGSGVTAYNGFAGGTGTVYVPMMFKKAYSGTANTALYVQNLDSSNSADVTLTYRDRTGAFTCSVEDTIPAGSSHGYWTPQVGCLTDGWRGGVWITTLGNVVAIGRPHFGNEVFAYDGFVGGSLTNYVPMLFADAYGGSYDSAYYLLNLDETFSADLTMHFYDTEGYLTCSHTLTIPPRAAREAWVYVPGFDNSCP